MLVFSAHVSYLNCNEIRSTQVYEDRWLIFEDILFYDSLKI